MSKRLHTLAVTLLTISCFSLPTLAQETQPTVRNWKSTLPKGEFRLTPSAQEGYFAVEANGAPLGLVLQAIAQQANLQLIISDEAQEVLGRSTIAMYAFNSFTLDKMLEMFTASNFSWGKVGPRTYLLVARQKSVVEVTSEKDRDQKLFLPQPKDEDAEPTPQEPEQAKPKGRMYLLSPQAQ